METSEGQEQECDSWSKGKAWSTDSLVSTVRGSIGKILLRARL